MKRLLTILTAIILILAISLQSEAKEKSLIYTIDIKKEIDNTTWIYLHNGLSEAKQLSADAILLHMNTYGGLLESADSMRTAILYSPIPVYVFIDNNAASAGALISIACKKIYMRKGANIGAATVVNQTGAAWAGIAAASSCSGSGLLAAFRPYLLSSGYLFSSRAHFSG